MKRKRRQNRPLGSNDISDDTILKALNSEIDRLADNDGAASWAHIGDAMADDLREQGYADWIGIAEFGDALSVDGDIVVSQQWLHRLFSPQELSRLGYSRSGTGNPLWNEIGKAKLEDYLLDNGFEETDMGGTVPTDEQEVWMEFVINAVVYKLQIDEERVVNAVRSEGITGEATYVSVSGETSIWARKPIPKYLQPL